MKVLQNINISKKILLIICISALALLVVGITGMSEIKRMADRSQDMYEDRLIPNTLISKVQRNSRINDSYLIELMVTKSKDRKQELLDGLKANAKETDEYIKELDELELSKKEEELYKIYKTNLESYNSLQEQVISLAENNFNESAYSLYRTSLQGKVNIINNSLDNLQNENQSEAKAIAEENNSKFLVNMYIMAGVIIISLFIAALMGRYISNMIVRPINSLKELMANAGNGNFSGRSTYIGKDEVGSLSTSYNLMADGMKSLIVTLTETSQHLAASSEQLSASSEESSKASEQISETIQELAMSSESQLQMMTASTERIQDVNENTEEITSNAKKVAETAGNAADISTNGTKKINEVTQQMQAITRNVTNLSQSIYTLETRLNEIGNITKVITDISSQTNLLALNAAIEAARAGEQGKGFAVVADEVRKLAEQTAKSADKITELISQIQLDSKNTTKSMSLAASEVDTGIAIVQDAGESFKEIEGSVKELVALFEMVFQSLQQLQNSAQIIETSIAEVSSMASESAASTENVSTATEEQVASMEEIAASSASLSLLANDLQEKIKQFKI